MRILLTHPFCRPYVRRGAETVLAQLTDYLVARGHSVTVLSSKPGDELVVQDGALRLLKSQSRGLAGLLHVSPRYYFYRHVRNYLQSNRFDLVHCIHYVDACAARISGNSTGVPYVYSMFGIPNARLYRARPIDHMLLKYAIGGAQEVMVLSRAAAALMKEGYGREPVCIPGFINPAEFPLVAGRDIEAPVILAVAAFSERRKGLNVLVAGFAKVLETFPKARLRIAGSVEPALKQRALRPVSKAAAARIEFLGGVTTEQLPGLYQGATVSVLPSLWEALGTVLLESLASGTPVVGATHCGIPDVVGDGVGYLFDPGPGIQQATNADGLAEAIVRAIDLHRDPDLTERCRRHIEQFTWKQRGPQIEAVYERAVREKGRGKLAENKIY